MRRLMLAAAIALGCMAPLVAAPPMAEEAAEPSGLFDLTKIHQFHLSVSAADYAGLEPAGGGNPFGPGPFGPGPGAPRPGGAPGGGQGSPAGGQGSPAGGQGSPAGGQGAVLNPADRGAGRFNYEFNFVHADFQANGETIKNIGLRYKGNGSYISSARTVKRPLKLDFDQFESKQRFAGFKKLNLNNGAMDPTKSREALAYAVFRAAGLPAPRTAFAEVRLTVPGKFDNEFLGLYTVVEQVDKKFLKTHFKSSDGLLLKPEGIRGIPFLGDDAASYEPHFNAKTDGRPEDWQRLIDFARLINQAEDEQFRREIADYLDVDNFARFLAVNTMLVNFDGFIGLGHNYYLYLDPRSNKFAFFPWDLDLSFGTFPMFGSAEQQMDLNIDHPHTGENKLIDRLLAMPAFKAAYRQQLQQLTATVFTPDSLGEQITTVQAAIADQVEQDKAAAAARRDPPPFAFGAAGTAAPSLSTFMEKRAESVTKQLAGTHKGYVASSGFGPGFGGGGPGFGPGGFGPGGFGPGRMMTRPLLEAADADKDGKLTPEEVTDATTKLFATWDKDDNGTLDAAELTAGINALVPPPQFGPPGGAPFGPPGGAPPQAAPRTQP